MVKILETEHLNIDDKIAQNVTAISGFQIISASHALFNHVDKGGVMWAGDGDRVVSQSITFSRPFDAVPNITLGLNGIDAAHDQNLRFWLQAVDVKPTGFTIQFNVWGDTHIARAGVSWQALGKAKPTRAR